MKWKEYKVILIRLGHMTLTKLFCNALMIKDV